ncbi:hypothetical protein [Merismopedia glauca]|uniref:Uncharacterized protein n=2 Tax=Merismopedia TaxID=53402 RepID=A0A2T1BXP2_9CYAN|nr:hypothetical protein [Merismopedia glauca]PSB00761.1 hypothetical protein C7B64_21865 [Merismopedia glauca CCAP 1448/3]
MTTYVASKSSEMSQNSQIWDSLKQAIATSSGFHRWLSEHPVRHQVLEVSLDYQVRRYLRETLETLAY